MYKGKEWLKEEVKQIFISEEMLGVLLFLGMGLCTKIS